MLRASCLISLLVCSPSVTTADRASAPSGKSDKRPGKVERLWHSDGSHPAEVLVDADAAYWLENSGPHKWEKANRKVVAVGASQYFSEALSADADHLYWVKSGDHTMLRIAKAPPVPPGAPVGFEVRPDIVYQNRIEPRPIEATAVDDEFMYFLTYSGALYRVRKVGGDAQLVARNGSIRFALDEHSAYLTAAHGGTVVKVDKTGGVPTQAVVLVENGHGPWGITVDATTVYFASWAGGFIGAVPKGGGELKKLAEDQLVPQEITLDDDYVYWTNNGTNELTETGNNYENIYNEPPNGSVMKVSKKGGKPIVLARHQFHPKGIAVDDKFVYWVDSFHGSVFRAPK